MIIAVDPAIILDCGSPWKLLIRIHAVVGVHGPAVSVRVFASILLKVPAAVLVLYGVCIDLQRSRIEQE